MCKRFYSEVIDFKRRREFEERRWRSEGVDLLCDLWGYLLKWRWIIDGRVGVGWVGEI